MVAEWYYAKGDKKHGPVTAERLGELAEAGELLPTDKVWQKGTKGWVRASTLPDLFPDDGPPPLPAGASDTSEDWKQQIWSRIWADKIVFLLICLVISFLLFLFLPFLFGTKSTQTHYGTITEASDGAKFVGTVLGLASFGLLVAVLVLAVLRLNKSVWWMKQSLPGRWIPVEANDHELEFSGPTIMRGKSLLGTFTISSDKKRMEIYTNGSLIETWTIITLKAAQLVIMTQQGVTKSYKRYDALSNLFTETEEAKRQRRLEGLQHKWEPVHGDGPAIQFTDDEGKGDAGAYIRFDGFAARYSLIAEAPFDTITILVGVDSISLKIISLERDELVLGGDGGSVHYKRGVSISAAEAKRRSDAFNEKMKAVGKGALLTVGAIGAGIAVLGVAAVAATAATATTTCRWCGYTTSGLHMNCPNCGR